MSWHVFRENLAALEAEHCRLQAENSGLRKCLAASTSSNEVNKCLREDSMYCDGQEASDVEPDLRFEAVQQETTPLAKRVASAAGEDQAPLHLHTAGDVEAGLPAQAVFHHDGIHRMTPVVPDGSEISPPNEVPIAQDMSRASTEVSTSGTSSLGMLKKCSTMNSAASMNRMNSMNSSFADFLGELTPQRSSTNSRRKTRAMDSRLKSLFSNEEIIKARVRQNCQAATYDVRDFYKDDGFASCVARSQPFEMATLMTIGVNSMWIAFDTDYNKAELLIDADLGFQVVENLFCFYFVFEILIRFAAFEYKRNCLGDYWFLFDVFLVIMMVLETWVFFIVGMFFTISIGNVGVLRIVRLFRLSRMARMARLLRAVPELMILIKGLAAAARSVLTTLLLLVILLYVFGIAFTQILRNTEAGALFFFNVAESMNTLWLYATLLNEIGWVCREVRASSPATLGLLYLFVLMASLTVMNMLIGVLCEVVNTIAIREKETAALNFVRLRIGEVFNSLGIDPEIHTITKDLFKSLIEHADGVKAISELGVDVCQLLDMADFIFQSDEIDDNFESLTRTLTFEEFVGKITDLRGANFATVKDIMQLRVYIRSETQKALHHQVDTFEKQLGHLETSESFHGYQGAAPRRSAAETSASRRQSAHGKPIAEKGSTGSSQSRLSAESSSEPKFEGQLSSINSEGAAATSPPLSSDPEQPPPPNCGKSAHFNGPSSKAIGSLKSQECITGEITGSLSLD